MLDELTCIPILWNIFPLHPHKPDNHASNRTPTSTEIGLGEPFLRELLAMVPVETVVAVGKKAAAGLTTWGIAAIPVRHPAHGGSTQFREELLAALGSTAVNESPSETR
ncbi:MAG: uracil-DNA glycosylase [Chloroflexota bacterium]